MSKYLNRLTEKLGKKLESTEAKRILILLAHFIVLIPIYFWYCTLEDLNIYKFLFAFTVGILTALSCLHLRD